MINELAPDGRPATYPIVIRPVAAGDDAALWRINEASVPGVGRIPTDRFRWFAERAAYMRVIEAGGELAGFMIALRPGTDYTSPNYLWFVQRYDDFLYVDRIAFAPGWQSRGLGRRLYRDLITFAGVHTPRLACEVNLQPPNPGSMRFHTALGFREVGRQSTDHGAHEVAMLEMPLAAGPERQGL